MRNLLGHLASVSICVFLVFSGNLSAQNLVPNPGFETISAAPTTYGQITNATGWSSAYGSCDLFHPSAGSGSVGVPANYFGSQAAHGGICYGGLAWSNSNSYHELLRVQLTSPLTIGNTYYAEAYVSAGEGSYRYGVNNFGFLLTTTPVAGGATDPPIVATPQVNWTTPITDYTNWTLVSGTFTASSAAQYLTLGSFFSTAATTWVLLGTAGSINSQYWYVDDVVVQPSVVLEDEHLAVSAVPEGERSVKVSWENYADRQYREGSVERSLDGGNVWTLAGNCSGQELQQEMGSISDFPQVYGTPVMYRLRTVSMDGTVSRSPAASVVVPVPSLRQSLVFAPNPVREGDEAGIQFYLDQTGACSISLQSRTGEVVWTHQEELEAGLQNIPIPVSGLPPGVYFLRVSNDRETAFTRFVLIFN